jgi:hypothetical protein
MKTSIGIVGAGSIVAKLHIPVLLNTPGVGISWITDVDVQRSRRLAKDFDLHEVRLPNPSDVPDADIVLLAIPYGARPAYYEALCTRQSGVPLRGVVPPNRIHRDQLRDTQPERGAFLQQARDRRAVDQRGKASRKDDSPLLPSFPLEPSATSAESAGLQPGEFVAAAGVTKANRELVAHELAATTGEDGRTAGETCPLLLALVGGEPSDETVVWQYAPADRRAVASGGIAKAVRAAKAIQTNSEGRGRFTKPDGKAVVSGFGTWVGHADPVPSLADQPQRENGALDPRRGV